ncbi:hypothetical protein JCM18899A_02800 [Nocardioides sp. AN3]
MHLHLVTTESLPQADLSFTLDEAAVWGDLYRLAEQAKAMGLHEQEPVRFDWLAQTDNGFGVEVFANTDECLFDLEPQGGDGLSGMPELPPLQS